MVVNPFFLHGSTQEQNLMQNLVNEQIQMYGIDVYYIPRTFIRDATIMREVTSSAFRSYFVLEAYLENFDGYGGQGDLMSKFGIQVKDEVTLTISRDRYENYIAPFLNSRMLYLMDSPQDDGQMMTIQRPKEGDLIYFPLGRRLFEIKFVEHEKPFYQLGKGYVYELQCELFEYEDEVLDTSVDEIDSTLLNKGYITTINLVPVSNRAVVTPKTGTGYITELTIFNEGSGYKSPPSIVIDPPQLGTDPSVVALLTRPDSSTPEPAIKQVVVFNSGSGYVEPPSVIAVGGEGEGSIIRAGINSLSDGIIDFVVSEKGAGYPEDVDIIVYDDDNNIVAQGKGLSDGDQIVSAIITNPGKDLPSSVRAIVAKPADEGDGVFVYNEIVVGQQSGMRARVRGWDQPNYQLHITNLDPTQKSINFQAGETIVGETSGAKYSLKNFVDTQSKADFYSDNDNIGNEGEEIVNTDDEYNQFFDTNRNYFNPDFSNNDPFGEQ
ncbi:neck protein [Synechococcus phage ACG-2014f]|uniref:Neck protein n=1 Tax=Synechococcus phage ACG-2014f TaxID=1493511 RepID=A0A0E3I5H1_9CAUD|nr:neck protein [Synechococcus phage ACG-2014f]